MNDKNRNPLHLFDDEVLPPPDWDPAQDADESWQTLVALMEKADTAPSLPPAEAEGLRAALRQQLTSEGLVGEKSRDEDTSLFAWFRVLLLGGGAGGQVIRLGVAAAIAAAVTLQYEDDSRGVMLADRSGRDTLFNAPAKSPKSQGSRSNKDEAAAEPVRSASLASGDVPQTLSSPPPAMASRQADAASAPGDGLIAGSESITRERQQMAAPAVEQAKSVDADQEASFAATKAIAQTRMPAPSGVGSLLGVTAASSGPASSELLAEAIEALQVAKVTAGLTTSGSTFGELRYVERALLAALSQASVDSDDMKVIVAALEDYSRAEELAEAGKFADSEAAYREAHANSRESFVGFLSMFQMARLRFESTQDYAGALAAYRSLLDDYPRQFMTDEYRDHVRGRISLLHRTSSDNWADLRRWSMAQHAPTPAAAAESLLTLLADYPTSTLAADAATRLSELLIDDAAPQSISFPEASRIMTEAVRRRELGPETARVQFALAEATFRRGMDPEQAIIEYQRALDMTPASDLRSVILDRLKAAASARIVPAVAPAPATLPASE